MRNWWVRFGCFLTGYNYGIVKGSSEIASKAVKRYTAALIIVGILWSFIGYTFTQRYLHGGLWGSLAGALVFVVIILQIERQIILSMTPSRWLYISRGIIAMMMAIIGAVIIDQIIFKEDIDLEKITFIEARVKKALPPKTEELRYQIAALDTAIQKKELERQSLVEAVAANPTITVYSTQAGIDTKIKQTLDPVSGQILTSTDKKSIPISVKSNVANPKIGMIAPMEQIIYDLRLQRAEKERALLDVRPVLEKEISSKVGFLDELEVMYSLITRSNVALSVWLIWFFFLLGLEMLVLISKTNEKENDYERTVKHHMDLQMRKLEVFDKMAGSN